MAINISQNRINQKKEVQKEVQVQKKSTDKEEPNLDKEKGKEEIDVIEC